jgi:hypothetical protein
MQPFYCNQPFDEEEITRAIALLFDRDTVVELRVLKVPKAGTVSGYFDRDHREDLIRAACEYSVSVR